MSTNIFIARGTVGQLRAVGTRPSYRGERVGFDRKKTLDQPGSTIQANIQVWKHIQAHIQVWEQRQAHIPMHMQVWEHI